jgi:uncharacterized protein YlaI
MPAITEAIIKETEAENIFTIDEALVDRRRDYLCPECRQRVRPHRASKDGQQAAHFEHLERNASCSLSHKEA